MTSLHNASHYVAPEHEFEAQLGLPEPLPQGEKLLWQGSPDWRLVARDAMHTRALSIYFGVLLAWRGTTVWYAGGSAADAGLAMLWLLPAAVLAIGVLTLMAWFVARTSVYTVTDRRVVMRIGVVLGITFNLPHSKIESAGLHLNTDGSGDVALTLADTDRIAYAHLWPHARPWRIKRAQPMLRGLRAAQQVAGILSTALVNAADPGRAAVSASTPTTPLNTTPTAVIRPDRQAAPNGANHRPMAA